MGNTQRRFSEAQKKQGVEVMAASKRPDGKTNIKRSLEIIETLWGFENAPAYQTMQYWWEHAYDHLTPEEIAELEESTPEEYLDKHLEADAWRTRRRQIKDGLYTQAEKLIHILDWWTDEKLNSEEVPDEKEIRQITGTLKIAMQQVNEMEKTSPSESKDKDQSKKVSLYQFNINNDSETAEKAKDQVFKKAQEAIDASSQS